MPLFETWLVASAGPQDIVYVFFAGHGGIDDETTTDTSWLTIPTRKTSTPPRSPFKTWTRALGAACLVTVSYRCLPHRPAGLVHVAPSVHSRAADPLAKIGQGDRRF